MHAHTRQKKLEIFSLEFALTNPRWDPLRHFSPPTAGILDACVMFRMWATQAGPVPILDPQVGPTDDSQAALPDPVRYLPMLMSGRESVSLSLSLRGKSEVPENPIAKP